MTRNAELRQIREARSREQSSSSEPRIAARFQVPGWQFSEGFSLVDNDHVAIGAQAIWADSIDRMRQFLNVYVNEPDRVAVVLCVAKMDALLHQAITQRLLPYPGSEDDLLDSDRGIGTFSSRIAAAHRLGLIHASLARALTLLRKIRNDLAHSFEEEALDRPPHRDRVMELSRNLLLRPPLQRAAQVILKQSPNFPQMKLLFIIVSTFIIAKLELLVSLVTRVDDRLVNMSKIE